MSDDEISSLFSAIDDDGDGSISESESSAFLDGLKTAGGGRPQGPPPGPPPAGGPPPPGGVSESEEDEEESEVSSVSLDLLTAASQAYSSSSGDTDLLSVLTEILDQAA